MINPREALATVADAALEVTVAGSFSKVGITTRRWLGEWQPVTTDLTGRVVLLTGASSGLGRAAAVDLAALGADLILVGRDAARLARVQQEARDAGAGDVRTVRADLTRLAVARRLVDQVRADFDRLDVLIHNAGALVHRYAETEDGFEQTYAAQVLAQHVITTGLFPLLRATPGSRVIVVSSGGMYAERLDVGTVQFTPDDYDGVRAYARAKRAQVALTEQWAARFPDSGVVFHSMHPGWADTPGVAESLPGFRKVTGPFLRTPDEGADTIVWLAAAAEPLASNGRFWLDRTPRNTVKVPWTKAEAGEAERLWDQVVAQTGADPA